jgi:hypothetical protein
MKRLELEDELELENELEGVFGALTQSVRRPKKQPNRRMILAFRIPDAPYSDSAFKKLHRFLEVTEGVHAALEIFVTEMAEVLAVPLTIVGGIVAGMVLPIMGPAAGYAEANAEIAKRELKSGFVLGVVTGADGRKWPFVKSRFWKQYFGGGAYPEGERIGQKSFNLGLASGFVQGRHLNANQRAFLWKSFQFSPSDLDYYRKYKASGNPRFWIDWYIAASTAFRKLYVKE